VYAAADVIPTAQHYGLQMHSYADDTQLYFHDKALSWDERLLRFIERISKIENWMTSNRLKMNSDKTDFIQATASKDSLPTNLPEWTSHPCLY